MKIEPIKIEGLAEFSRNLRKLDADLPKALRVALNDSAAVVVDWVRPRVPKRSGRAARSVKARSTRTAVRIAAGGSRAPYFPWLDYGGKVGRNRSVDRRFVKDGRYLYAGYRANRDEVQARLHKALLDTAAKAGIEVT